MWSGSVSQAALTDLPPDTAIMLQGDLFMKGAFIAMTFIVATGLVLSDPMPARASAPDGVQSQALRTAPADTADSAGSAPEEQGLDVVTVTARRRAENL